MLNTEDINTGLGKGKLFTIERDHPAAADNNERLTEIHAIILADISNLAYDIWIKGDKQDTLIGILRNIHYNKKREGIF